jgi:membrane-bound ClpP family serine protease
MRGAMALDIRLPIGGLFTVLGVLLGVYGLAVRSEDAINIDLWWGIVMLLFGLGMLIAGMRTPGRDAAHPAAESPEGRATEEREHRIGLER